MSFEPMLGQVGIFLKFVRFELKDLDLALAWGILILQYFRNNLNGFFLKKFTMVPTWVLIHPRLYFWLTY